MNLGKVTLKPAKDKSIKRFHPWIFSTAVKEIDQQIKEGDVVEVYSNKGKYLGTGHFQDGIISIRVFEFKQQIINVNYWKEHRDRKMADFTKERYNHLTALRDSMDLGNVKTQSNQNMIITTVTNSNLTY